MGDSIIQGKAASIESAEVQSDGSAVIVLSPSDSNDGKKTTVLGRFFDNGTFIGTTQRSGEASFSTQGTHTSTEYRFNLAVPVSSNPGGNLTILGTRIPQ